MLGHNASCVRNGEDFLYADIVHPTMNGHLLIACLLGNLFENTLNNIKNLKRNSNLKEDIKIISFPPIHNDVLMYSNPICYSMLKPTKHRLRVVDFQGFQIVARPKHGSTDKFKRCWEGNQAG